MAGARAGARRLGTGAPGLLEEPDGSAPDLRLGLPAAAAWVTAWQGRLAPAGLLLLLALVLLLVGGAVLLRATHARSAPWWRSREADPVGPGPRRSGSRSLLRSPSRSRAAVVAATCVCAAAAGIATAARQHALTTGPLAQAARTRAAVQLQGVLLDDPRVVPARGDVLAFQQLVVARLRVERLLVAGRSVRLRAPVLVLSSDSHWLGLLPSQHVQAEGRLEPAATGDDVAALLSARGPPVVRSAPSLLQRVAGRLRHGLQQAARPLPADEAGLLPGLVEGDTSGLDPRLQRDFRTTGLTHLTAVSGTNVAVVLAAALVLCGWLRVGLRWRPPVALLVLLAFVVLARPSPSVLRAAVMGVIALVALATGSRRQAPPALCGAVLVLVLLSPELAAQPGFALSTLATAGLLLVAPVWRARLGRHLPERWAEAVAVPAAAQLACTPVVVALSGQVGVYAVPANLLAVPAVAPATLLGVVAALLAPLSLGLAQAAAWCAWLPTRWLTLVAHVGARQPGAGLAVARGWTGALLAVGAIALGALVLGRRRLRRAAASALAGVLLAALVVVVTRPPWPPPGWVLVSCDVGQGDGFVVRLTARSALVVDTGPDTERMGACLSRLGVDRVPLLVLTHLHADHVEGVPGLLRGRQVAEVEIGPLDEPAVERGRLMGWLAPRHVPVVRAVIGEVRQASGVSWEVLDATARHGTDSDPNNSSIVLRLRTHGITVLFAGDLEGDAQRSLLERGVDLRADVLKVPHHGSRKQDSDFLDAVHARIALTPVGAGNPYGHPAASTLARLERDGARTYRSDRDGDVAVVVRHGRVSSVARHGQGTPGGTPGVARTGPPAVRAATWRSGVPPAPGSLPGLGVPADAMTRCDVPGAPPPAVARGPPP